MISLVGGELYQWDTGRIVKVIPDSDAIVHEVHFSTKAMDFAYVVKTYIENSVTYCAIPNIILQQSNRVLCYEVCENSNGEETIADTQLDIVKRNRPEDYIYTEQERITIEDLASRIETVKTIADNAMTKENPTGTGSFSLNRKANTTVGEYSFAEGNNTTANGDYSHAEGMYTIASSRYQHAQGRYNIQDFDNIYADIIGNGSNRTHSNAATVDWKGNAWYSGDVYVGSTSGTNKDDGSKKLATEEYVNSKAVTDDHINSLIDTKLGEVENSLAAI